MIPWCISARKPLFSGPRTLSSIALDEAFSWPLWPLLRGCPGNQENSCAEELQRILRGGLCRLPGGGAGKVMKQSPDHYLPARCCECKPAWRTPPRKTEIGRYTHCC